MSGETKETPLKRFTDYFRHNYPGPNTVISNPDWHAPKIFRAATYDLENDLAALRADNARLRDCLERLAYRLDIDARTADGITKTEAANLARAALAKVES